MSVYASADVSADRRASADASADRYTSVAGDASADRYDASVDRHASASQYLLAPLRKRP
jgi:hypothetical protein